MKNTFYVLSFLSLSTFAIETPLQTPQHDAAAKQKALEQRCAQYAVQAKVPQKKLSVFMAECMASLSLSPLEENEENPISTESPTKPKKP
ncbi:MAG: hypothetical protein RIT27_1841 [Pseudomonadota bacterium]|jgi:hypothetical protein